MSKSIVVKNGDTDGEQIKAEHLEVSQRQLQEKTSSENLPEITLNLEFGNPVFALE